MYILYTLVPSREPSTTFLTSSTRSGLCPSHPGRGLSLVPSCSNPSLSFAGSRTGRSCWTLLAAAISDPVCCAIATRRGTRAEVQRSSPCHLLIVQPAMARSSPPRARRAGVVVVDIRPSPGASEGSYQQQSMIDARDGSRATLLLPLEKAVWHCHCHGHC